MPKKYHTRRHLKGGSNIGQTFTNLGNSISSVASSAWNNTKKALGLGSGQSSYTPSSQSSYSPSSYTPSTSSMSSSSTSLYNNRGGKKGRKTKRSRKNKRGGFNPNMQPLLADRADQPISTLAARAAPFSGITASASYVGGRKRKTRRVKH
jgi:hypothetical protein